MNPRQSNDDQIMANGAKPDSDGAQRSQSSHTLETGIGAVSGGVVGGVIGSAIAGRKGGVVGAIAGAVTVGVLADANSDELKALEQQAAELLGEAPSEKELPAHYSWEQLQALSKPQTP